MREANGFTLIELISVIIILGILTVSTVGVFSDKDEYGAPVVKNQLLSSLRLSQQLALSRQDLTTSTPVTLSVSQSGDNWVFTLWDSDPSGAGATPFKTTTIERNESTLAASTSDFTSTCASLATTNAFNVTFDGNGDLLSGNRMRICVSGMNQICVTGLGFAYEGAVCL
ncbi:MAG: prepilin-type N-terminal cleavage/methylation domain-containing protein [Ketobacteraceae bacterium]|nr:prepilin-type N-terminal cleavage/methylation domain-containing protein [Ketobacteraceae bacterium]